MFLFSFYARGMSFVDMAYLRKDNIWDNTLHYQRHKTHQVFRIAITPHYYHIKKSPAMQAELFSYYPFLLSL